MQEHLRQSSLNEQPEKEAPHLNIEMRGCLAASFNC